MKKYQVSLIEKVPYAVFVEANSVNDAKKKAEEVFINSHITPIDKDTLEQWGETEIQIKGVIKV